MDAVGWASVVDNGVIGHPPQQLLVAGVRTIFVVRAFSSKGRPVQERSSNVTAKLQHKIELGVPTRDEEFFEKTSISISDDYKGSYFVSLLCEKPGTCFLIIHVNSESVCGSPFLIKVVPGEATKARIKQIDEVIYYVPGMIGEFTVCLYDSNDNQIHNRVSCRLGVRGVGDAFIEDVVDMKNGEYLITFMIPPYSEFNLIDVWLNGHPIDGSPFTPQISISTVSHQLVQNDPMLIESEDSEHIV
eukprot:GHVL01030669.1.p1 GENE.GHVL01030669.1~~GHVL01030669.1.p1  ORF type:complete len:245 (+),score=41.46 GHVL01030669.1:50-784(+)